jgi:hypothetical protein
MSDDNLAFSGGIGAAASIATFIFIYILKPFFTAANHKRIRSICCGRACVTSLDVEDTTPTVVLRVLPPSGVQSPRPLPPSPSPSAKDEGTAT